MLALRTAPGVVSHEQSFLKSRCVSRRGCCWFTTTGGPFSCWQWRAPWPRMEHWSRRQDGSWPDCSVHPSSQPVRAQEPKTSDYCGHRGWNVDLLLWHHQQKSECSLIGFVLKTPNLQEAFEGKRTDHSIRILQLPMACCCWCFGCGQYHHGYLLCRNSYTKGCLWTERQALNDWHPDRPDSPWQCQVRHDKGCNSECRWAVGSSSAPPDLQSRPRPMQLLVVLSSEGQTYARKCSRVLDLSKMVNSELRTIPQENYRKAFSDWLRWLQLYLQFKREYFQQCPSYKFDDRTIQP